MEDGSISSADINELYGLLIQDNNTLKKSPKELPDSEKNRYRAAIYDSLKAVAGMGSVPTYEGNKKLKGILQTIAGDSPKMGFFQSKIMKRRQELSMRSTITPAPEMALDQVGLPKDAAMDLYKPFVVRELIKSGKDVIDAQKEVKERSPLAWRALELAVQNRPVLLKRDPVLHKYNIQAFYPKLMEGNSIKIHPLLCAGFNADHDGDTMAAYLPVSEEARKEAIEKMLPSKNLFSSTNYGIMHAPDQEAVMGLHYLTNYIKPLIVYNVQLFVHQKFYHQRF
jgi:DNA-directed RNA polymerase subunit beta'